MKQEHFTSVRFHHFKAFREYTVALSRFNVLVGPNNSGKSTILAAFRILAEAIRKARARNPELIPGPRGVARGYTVDLRDVPIATENVFYDYDESTPASVRFRISNGNELLLYFPERGTCFLFCETKNRPVTTTSTFKSKYNVSVGFVPVLGPVEHNEELYQKEAARLALLTHRAARNFRNIWYHYGHEFEEFRELIRSTWPGMDIRRPEIDGSHEKTLLRMFCPEERIPREIYWAGFGFQVWCQMLTYIVRGRDTSLFIIDEPDIYLHADLQRQLLGILKTLGPDILIATHSTEIITEADADELVVVNKKQLSGKRLKNPAQLQKVFQTLGSNLNPTLTQLAKTRRALFVEGKDFQVLSRFARKLNYNQVANRSDFAVIPAEGFNSSKVRDFLAGMETTLGCTVSGGVVFDRDYRSAAECKKEIAALRQCCSLAHIHDRKELENFLLVPEVLDVAIQRRIVERNRRANTALSFTESAREILTVLTEPLRHKVEAQYLARRRTFEKAKSPGIDDSTIDERLMREFDLAWNSITSRMLLVPGKDVLSTLNLHLQNSYGVSLTSALIIDCFNAEQVPVEMQFLIEKIEEFRRQPADSAPATSGHLVESVDSLMFLVDSTANN
jgi:energy-coupling factor transporter ATP-binding protein EcfA2